MTPDHSLTVFKSSAKDSDLVHTAEITTCNESIKKQLVTYCEYFKSLVGTQNTLRGHKSAHGYSNDNKSEMSIKKSPMLINLLESNWLQHKQIAIRNQINRLNWRVIHNISTESERQLERYINIKASS